MLPNLQEYSESPRDRLLQNLLRGYSGGDSPMFWAEPSGYTPYIDEAKLFTKEEASKWVAEDSEKWRSWSLRDLERYAKRVVDINEYNLECLN